jgi:hypothetical protein
MSLQRVPKQQPPNGELFLAMYPEDRNPDAATLKGFYADSVTTALTEAKANGAQFIQTTKSLVDCKTLTDVKSIYSQMEANAYYTISQGDLFRDLGKELRLNVGPMLVARFRYVELVQNADGYGHSGIYIYILTFYSRSDALFDISHRRTVTFGRTGTTPNKTIQSAFFQTALPSGFQYPATVSPVTSFSSVSALQTAYAALSGSRSSLAFGTYLRDMGKTLTFTVNGVTMIQWQLVQEVTGDATLAEPFYIVCYCADKTYFNDPVVVVRTGTSTENPTEMNYFTTIRTAENGSLPATIFYTDTPVSSDFVQYILNSATAAGKTVQTIGSTFVFSSLADAVSTYSQMKGGYAAISQQNQDFTPFATDMKTTFDFVVDGTLVLRIRKININATSLSEGFDSVVFDTIWYFPIYVSDPVAFGETVVLSRCG